ncbi:hypothetical protein LUZ60_013006 [Juncus effusus]|nr:hypothetical protein LUZ60_013006 [Juncus effusus]
MNSYPSKSSYPTQNKTNTKQNEKEKEKEKEKQRLKERQVPKMVGVMPAISNPFPCPTVRNHHRHRWTTLSPPAAAGDDASEETSSSSADSDFDRRVLQIQTKYRSGTGKKAEIRKAKKAGLNPGVIGKKKTVMLPPVPLVTPTSINGAPVEVGFTSYSEKLNGFLAGLGLAALLLVELGSGKSVLKYHTPSIVFVQIYTVASVGALFVKYEKEKISVWPKARSTDQSGTVTEN